MMRKTTKAIIYPLEIRACKVVQNDHEVNSFAGQLADFSMLPTRGSLEDCLPPRLTPNISEDLVSKPFEATSYPLEDGIHLHWSLPKALRTAHIYDPESVEEKIDKPKIAYRDAPNRWLVKRRVFKLEIKGVIDKSQENEKNLELEKPKEISEFGRTFYIESDLLSIGDPEGSNAFPYKPPHYQPGDPLYRYIGKCWDYEQWKTRYEDKMVKKGEEIYHKNLNAFGYGEPLYAAYYPECKNVFGFHDDLEVPYATDALREELMGQTSKEEKKNLSLLKTDRKWQISYHVIGWYENSFYDPTYLATVASQKLHDVETEVDSYTHSISQTQNGFDLNWEIDDEHAGFLFDEVLNEKKKEKNAKNIDWELDGRLLFSRKLEVDWPIESEKWMYDALDKSQKLLWQSEDDTPLSEELREAVKAKDEAENVVEGKRKDLKEAKQTFINAEKILINANTAVSNATKEKNNAATSVAQANKNVQAAIKSVDEARKKEKAAIEKLSERKKANKDLYEEAQQLMADMQKIKDQTFNIFEGGPLGATKLPGMIIALEKLDRHLKDGVKEEQQLVKVVKTMEQKLSVEEKILSQENTKLTKALTNQTTKEKAEKDAISLQATSKIAMTNATDAASKTEKELEVATSEAEKHTIESIATRVSQNSIVTDKLIIHHIANLLARYPKVDIEILYSGKALSKEDEKEIDDPEQLKIMEEVLIMAADHDIALIKENIKSHNIENTRFAISNVTERADDWQKKMPSHKTFLAIAMKSNNTPADFDTLQSLKTLSNTKIAIGNTPPQAYAALIANLSTKEGTKEEKNKKIQSKELLLDALQLGLLTQLDEPDLIPRIDNGIHQSSFIPEEGGHLWKIVMRASENEMQNKVPSNGAKASAETMVLWSKELKKLNNAQAQFDELRYTIYSEQKELYADWYKFMTAEYNLKLGVITQKTQVNDIREYLIKQMKKLYDNFMLLEKVNSNVEKFRTSLKANLESWMQQDNAHRKLYELEKVVHDRFWSPAEPAILLHGKDIEHSTRYHEPKPDVVKIITVQLSLDNDELMIQLLESMNGRRADDAEQFDQDELILAIQKADFYWQNISFGSGLLFNTLEAETWDPIYLDWQVKLYPVTKPYSLDNEQYPWQEDAVLKNFDLENGEIDLLLNTDDSDNTKHLIDYFVKQDATKVLQTVDGRSILTPNAQQSMIQAIKDAWAHTLPQDLKNQAVGENDLINSINKVKILSQNLSGLNDAFLMQKQILQLSVFDPLADNQVLDDLTNGMLRKLIGKANDTSPMPHNLFLPIREGYLRISKLRMVDTFGRINIWDADDHFERVDEINNLEGAPEIILAESFKKKKETYEPSEINGTAVASNTSGKKLAKQNLHAAFLERSAFLPPRLAQPSRLQVKLHDATEQRGPNAAHAPSEQDLNFNLVCGWLLPNFLDETLYVYDADGKPLKVIGVFKRKITREEIIKRRDKKSELEEGIVLESSDLVKEKMVLELVERPVPGHNKVLKTENEYLQKVIEFLLKSHHNTTDPVANFREFIATGFSALQNVEPKQFAQFTGTALMMGKPLAIIRASLNLEIKGAPATDYNWKKSMTTYLGNDAVNDGTSRKKIVSQMGFTRVKFPLRLGAVSQANDGLVGYFILPQNQQAVSNSAAQDQNESELSEFFASVCEREIKHTAAEYSNADKEIIRLKKEQVFMPDARILMPFVKELYRWAIDESAPTKSTFLDAAIAKIDDTNILGEGEEMIAQVARLSDAAFEFINKDFKNWMGTLDIAQLLDNCLKCAYHPMEEADLNNIRIALSDLHATQKLIGQTPDLTNLNNEEQEHYLASIALLPLVWAVLEYGGSAGSLEYEEKMGIAYSAFLTREDVPASLADPLELTQEKHLSVRGRLRLQAIFQTFAIRLDVQQISQLTDIYFEEETELILPEEEPNKIKANLIIIENKEFLYSDIQFEKNERAIDNLKVVLQDIEIQKDAKAPNIYNAPKPTNFSLTADGAKQEILMLVDPRAKVHVTMGILPVKAIEIPPDAIAEAIKNIQMTFLTAPILTPPVDNLEKDFLTIPTLKEEASHWAWLEKEDKEKWRTLPEKNIQRPPESQINIPHPLTLREGWLQLQKGIPEKDDDTLVSDRDETAQKKIN